MEKSQVHALFIVDQSDYNAVKEFKKVIEQSTRSGGLTYDVYSYTNKGRMRVSRNVGALNFRPVKTSQSATFKAIVEAFEKTGSEIDSLHNDAKPETVAVFIMTNKNDVDSTEEDLAKAIESISTQMYTYNWKIFVLGESRNSLLDQLHLQEKNIARAKSSIVKRIINDLVIYKDAGSFPEDRE